MAAQRFVLVSVGLAASVLGGAWPDSSLAQATGGPYTLREWVISAGGARVETAPFGATVTAGQPAAITAAAGRFRLVGGFHQPAPQEVPLFHDGFEDAVPAAPTASRPLTSRGTSP